MDSLFQRVRQDLDQARKARERERLAVLSMTLSEMKNAAIEKRDDLTDEEVHQVLVRAIKKRREASDQMRSAGREERADQEAWEADLLQKYLPPPLGEDEVRAMVRDAIADGADQMGAVMGRVMPALRGRFDGKEAGRIVREELQG